ncbi:hypothetical protein Hanom_Chr17g01537011 [Helianthus anomalus]
MDGVNEPGENGKISNLWTIVAKLAKPQGQKWHFTLNNKIQFFVPVVFKFKYFTCKK